MVSAVCGGISLGWTMHSVSSQVSGQGSVHLHEFWLSVSPSCDFMGPRLLGSEHAWFCPYQLASHQKWGGQTMTFEMQVVCEQFKCSSQPVLNCVTCSPEWLPFLGAFWVVGVTRCRKKSSPSTERC